MRATTTDQDAEDVRAMFLEQKYQPEDHRDLWDKIPDVVPAGPHGVLRPLKAAVRQLIAL